MKIGRSLGARRCDDSGGQIETAAAQHVRSPPAETPFETTMPSISDDAISDEVEIVVLVRYRITITPGMPIGTENMMMKGSISDLNWAAITMYTRINAKALA